MEEDKEIFGYIKFISSPTFISKRNKYLIEVRSYIQITRLEYSSFEIFHHTVDILRKRKLKRSRGRLGKIIEEFDKEEGNIFYHYLFYVSCDEKYEVADVAQHLQEHLEREEGYKIQSAYGEQVKLFPWEKDKVTSRIPITQKMIDGIVQKVKEKK